MSVSPRSHGQRDPRLRKAGRTALTTGLARGTLLIGVLLTAPLVEHHLGSERLGIWLTLVSLISLLAVADLGLGNGVMTLVARASGGDKHSEMRTSVANGLATLGLSSVIFALLAGLAMINLDIPKMLGISSPALAQDVSVAVATFVLIFIAGLPLVTIEKAQWGLQRGYIASSWMIASSVITIVSIVVIVANGGRLMHLALALAGIPVLFAAANTVWSFAGPFNYLRPRSGDVTVKGAMSLLKLGWMYLILQLAAAVAFSTDTLIVGGYLGAETVPSLAIPARMFGLVNFILGLFLMPLWPEYASAMGRSDTVWARRTALRSFRIAGGVSFVMAIGVAGLSYFLSPLLGVSTRPSISLLLGLIVWTVATVLGSTLSIFLNAIGELRFQVRAALVMLVAVVFLRIVFVQRGGIEGLVWGGLIGYVAVMGPFFVWLAPRVFRQLSETSTARS